MSQGMQRLPAKWIAVLTAALATALLVGCCGGIGIMLLWPSANRAHQEEDAPGDFEPRIYNSPQEMQRDMMMQIQRNNKKKR